MPQNFIEGSREQGFVAAFYVAYRADGHGRAARERELAQPVMR